MYQRGDFMEIFTTLVICFLSVYGTFQLLYNISVKVSTNKIPSDKLHSVLIIDDSADAECYIRNLLLKRTEEEVFILNLSENNDTARILEILCYEYPRIKITKKDDYIEYINNIE